MSYVAHSGGGKKRAFRGAEEEVRLDSPFPAAVDDGTPGGVADITRGSAGKGLRDFTLTVLQSRVSTELPDLELRRAPSVCYWKHALSVR
jgi:hypothetical protein